MHDNIIQQCATFYAKCETFKNYAIGNHGYNDTAAQQCVGKNSKNSMTILTIAINKQKNKTNKKR